MEHRGVPTFRSSRPRQAVVLAVALTASLTGELVSGRVRGLTLARSGRDILSGAGGPSQSLAGAGLSTAVRAAGRRTPWVNLNDGREVRAVYIGSSKVARSFESGSVEALALAVGDLDEDGVPDLVCGYAMEGAGALALHRGNADAIYPNSAEAQKRRVEGEFSTEAFLPDVRVLELPQAPEFLAVGDFDGDGHKDVVAAATGRGFLYFLRGDGKGAFASPAKVDLPGAVTTMAAGDVNRPDGLDDLVVGVTAPDGAKILVFESPEGALRGSPELFALPRAATSVAMGKLDDDSFVDLAVAAGHDLLVLHGRDRQLSIERPGGSSVPRAVVERLSFPFLITTLATGEFIQSGHTDLAMLSEDGVLHWGRSASLIDAARHAGDPMSALHTLEGLQARTALLVKANVSTAPNADLLVSDRANDEVHVITLRREGWLGEATSLGPGSNEVSLVNRARPTLKGRPVAILPMRLNGDALSDLVILREGPGGPDVSLTTPVSTFLVTNTNDGGKGSLRAAILDANASPGSDAIQFNISPSGAHTISPTSPLPTITESVILDATTQPGFAGIPLIQIDGQLAGPDTNGLDIGSPDTTIRGLVITRFFGNPLFFTGNGIYLDAGSAGNDIIEGNVLGTTPGDAAGMGNDGAGVFLRQAHSVTLGGTTAAARNVISGNLSFGVTTDAGVADCTGNVIQGNFIGTGIAGGTAQGNASGGVFIDCSDNVIGGLAPGARNLISGNSLTGILIGSETAWDGLVVQGNFIGTDVGGAVPVPNGGHGILVRHAASLTIGGTVTQARNVISGNGNDGILVEFGVPLVQGNFIGTDISGGVALGNAGNGVESGGGSTTIGGSVAGARNVISGNGVSGISLHDSAAGVLIQGNFIGVDGGGMAALGNGSDGITIFGSCCSGRSLDVIGGTFPGAGNVISGNRQRGVSILGNGSSNNVVQGNLIGVDATGGAVLANGGEGILIDTASGNTIGGTSSGARNVISGNSTGINVRGTGVANNVIQGNFIGTDSVGTRSLGNVADGIDLHGSSNIVGGGVAGAGNVISGNLRGVYLLPDAANNTLQGNLIGTDPTARTALPNMLGILVSGPNNSIGGTATGAGNIISGNTGYGILIYESIATGNQVLGNSVGTDVTGGLRLGNGSDGVRLTAASNNFIGGMGSGAGNTIAYNSGAGVFVSAGTGNAISSNSTFSNGGLGIDLFPMGVTPNDPGDPDTGANNLQNFPLLTAASCGATVTVKGALNSTPLSKYDLEFYTNASCDSSGYGEGEKLLGIETSVPTDGSGDVSFAFTFPGPVAPGTSITATATDDVDNTSEFSNCAKVTGSIPGEVTDVRWSSGSTTSLEWPPVPDASYYNVYRGVPANLPNLLNTNLDSCLEYSGPATTTGAILVETPPPGFFYWYLVRAANACGEGPAGDARVAGGLKPRIQDSSGPCVKLSHDECTTGAPLVPTIDFCVAEICVSDPICCNTLWDDLCTIEVVTVCNSMACPEGTCSHPLCSVGMELQPNCDVPPLVSSCVTAICNAKPGCCSSLWDSTCVDMVRSVCGKNCI